jgi:hypothetical protein
MVKERKPRSLFFDIFLYIGIFFLATVFAAIITFMILVFAHLFLYERPPFVNQKMWRGMFFQNVNWTYAAIIWSVLFFAFQIGLFEKDLKRWVSKKLSGE